MSSNQEPGSEAKTNQEPGPPTSNPIIRKIGDFMLELAIVDSGTSRKRADELRKNESGKRILAIMVLTFGAAFLLLFLFIGVVWVMMQFGYHPFNP